MVHNIIARQDGAPNLIIRIKTDVPVQELKPAIKDAVTDFLENGGTKADTALSASNDNFNWGDFALWLPEEYAKKHGFEVLDAGIASLTVDHDESLLP